MITYQQKRGIGTSLCVCCCCMVIFGIVGIIYYEKSFLNIHHECEIYYIYTRLCQYACGTVCHRRLLTDKVPTNDTNTSPQQLSSDSTTHHCYTRYCWGYEYVYAWKTIDSRYHPYRAQTAFVNNTDHLHAYKTSPLSNQSEQTVQKLSGLLRYINNESNAIFLNEDEIQSIHLETYITYNDDIASNILHTINDNTYTTTKTATAPLNHSVSSCDWKRPAYNTYSTCSHWPLEWYSLGDSESCWSNDACTYFSTLSPYANWDLAKGFGYASAGCLAMFVLILLYGFVCWCYAKLCGWNDYDVICDTMYSDEEYDSDPVIVENPVMDNTQMVINDSITPQMYGNEDEDEDICYEAAAGTTYDKVVIVEDEEIVAPSAPFEDDVLLDNMEVETAEGRHQVVQQMRYDDVAYTMK